MAPYSEQEKMSHRGSDIAWLSTILRTGTLGDRLAAITLRIQVRGGKALRSSSHFNNCNSFLHMMSNGYSYPYLNKTGVSRASPHIPGHTHEHGSQEWQARGSFSSW